MVNWTKIRNDYVHGNKSQAEIAKKYGVSVQQVSNHARQEQWVARRRKQREKISEKLEEKTAEKIAERESDIEAHVSDLKAKIRVMIYEQILTRMADTEKDTADFRRLVQNYHDMMDLEPEAKQAESDAFNDLMKAIGV